MSSWKGTTAILCAFGLLKELRPSESYVVEYIVEYKNISSDTVIHVAFPISTYTYLGTLILVFLLTDFLRYRSIVIFEGLIFILTYAVLIWGTDLTSLIVVEVLYGICYSTEVAYFAYIYAQVSREDYKKVTSFTYTALIIGRFLSGLSAQLLVSTETMDLHELNYVTFSAECAAFFVALFLPKVSHSIYFNRAIESTTALQSADSHPSTIHENENGRINLAATDFQSIESSVNYLAVEGIKKNKLSIGEKIRLAKPILWNDFKAAYSQFYILKWSIWWAIATAGMLQVINYIQSLWEVIATESDADQTYNGATDAIYTFLSAVLALAAGFINISWKKWGELILCLSSLVQGIVLILMSKTESIFIAYSGHIIFRVLYQVMITIATSEVVDGINTDSQGLVFGINTFFALLVQTILTVVITDSTGLALKEREQFFVYGFFFIALALFFLFIIISTFILKLIKKRNKN